MSRPDCVLLTGATGFLGRGLLLRLLASGRRVAVLVRDASAVSPTERIRDLLAAWEARAAPVVLGGDLCAPGLGLSAADRGWLARRCRSAVHAAADVSFRRLDGGPWATNVEGTQRLLEVCAEAGVTEFHHVSTAFVCGDRAGPVREDELDRSQGFHNDYERSKFEAERRVRASGLRATVYRPSVIVGDSRTGRTSSYHGFYRFLEAADRLASSLPAETTGAPGKRLLPLRLPLSGDEPRDLVPVDWVARAVVRIVNRRRLHGLTYHLTAAEPVRVRDVKETAEEVLNLSGVRLVGPAPLTDATPLEEAFLGQVRDYEPYFEGDPVFDRRCTLTALPGMPPPPIDRALLTRLIRFAVADGWGRSRRRRPAATAAVDCAAYVERFFPEAARRSVLARIPLDLAVGLDVSGPGGGRWTLRWTGGELGPVRRGLEADAAVIYRLDRAAFEAVVRGRQTPQEAFLARRIAVQGDVEKGLKLAVLFGGFVKEFPFEGRPPREESGAAVLSA
jgi:nucleoside-diphosphate-sugar epimerase